MIISTSKMGFVVTRKSFFFAKTNNSNIQLKKIKNLSHNGGLIGIESMNPILLQKITRLSNAIKRGFSLI